MDELNIRWNKYHRLMGRDDILNKSVEKIIWWKIRCIIILSHEPKQISDGFKVKNIITKTLKDKIGSIKPILNWRKYFSAYKHWKKSQRKNY